MKQATVFRIECASVEVATAALICGDGVDLVVRPYGKRSRTVQLSVGAARELAKALSAAADESVALTR